MTATGKTAVLLLLALLAFPHPAFSGQAAKDLSKKEKELEAVRKKIEAESKSLKEVSRVETSVLEDLDRADRRLVGIKGELMSAEASLKRIDEGMKSASVKMALLSSEERILKERLGSRLRAMYMMRAGAVTNAVFSSPTLEEFDRRQRYLALIMESDLGLIERLGENISLLEAERARQARLKRENESLRLVHLDKKREVEKTVAQKKKLLGEVKGKRQSRERLIAELGEAQGEMTSLIERLRKESEREDAAEGGGFGAMRGKLGMPVEGEVVSFYGEVRHPKFNTVTFNNGIVIKARFGTAVKNTYRGKVAFVGWLKGYGQVMIVEHDGGWYTLFGRLYKALKAVGEAVSPGEAIALVGEGGLGEGPGLYFEVRHKGAAKDPLKWFASR